MLWPVVALFAAPSAGLVVETGSPDALCPALEPTRAAVRDRLGALELAGRWRATYTLVHREDGDYVELTLEDPAGEVKLTRSLPVGAQPCAHLSQAIALVLERYFRRLVSEAPALDAPVDAAQDAGTASEAPSSQPEAPPPAIQPEGAPAETAHDGSADAAPGAQRQQGAAPEQEAARGWSLALAVGASVTPLWLAPSLGLVASSGEGFTLNLRGGVSVSSRDEMLAVGSVEGRLAPLALTAGWRWESDGEWLVSLLGGPALIIETAESQGLADASSGVRGTPAATFQFSLGHGLGRRVRVLGGFEGYVFLREAAPEFQVSDEAVLELPRFSAGGAVWLELTL